MACDAAKTPGFSNRRAEPPNKRPNSELESSPETSFSRSTWPKEMFEMEDVLNEIREKLKKLDKLDSMAEDIKDLKETVYANGISLEQTRKDLESVKGQVKSVQKSVRDVTRENLQLKERLLEMTARSMQDNLIFSGISEEKDENVEQVLKTFFSKELGINTEIAQQVGFLRIHRLRPAKPKKRSDSNRPTGEQSKEEKPKPRAIIACFAQHAHKEMVFARGPMLKGKPYGINQQYPVEIVDRRKALLPVYKEEKKNKKEKGRVRLVADKLYIDNELYKDATITPWLYLLDAADAE